MVTLCICTWSSISVEANVLPHVYVYKVQMYQCKFTRYTGLWVSFKCIRYSGTWGQMYLKFLDQNLAHTWSSGGHQVLCSLRALGTAGPADQGEAAAAAACQVIQSATNTTSCQDVSFTCLLSGPPAKGITLTFQSLLFLVNTFSLCLYLYR